MHNLSLGFSDFIAQDCNRSDFIQNYLSSHGIECPIIPLDGKNHLYVKFPIEQYNPMFKIKTVIAHYDRFPGSIGANDNSAAVFSMLEWAVRLKNYKSFHNIRLVFTDGEELGAEGIKEQGAFALAQLFKRLGIVNDDVFVFDCMGRGDVPVICTTPLPKNVTKKFCKQYYELEEKAENLLKMANNGKWFKLPAHYSDNAGFIANGIPAITISMLPSDEISLYYSLLLRLNKIKDKAEIKSQMDECYPKTWKLLHTENDSINTLSAQAFEITGNILNKLAELKTVVSS